jgi:hypothetical protein
MYYNEGNQVFYRHYPSNEVELHATCATVEGAVKAVKLLNDAIQANAKRHYTKSCRLNRQSESVTGFQWSKTIQAMIAK